MAYNIPNPKPKVIVSKRTGIKYLSVDESEKFQRKTEKEFQKKYGMKIKTQFHGKYIEVPLQDREE